MKRWCIPLLLAAVAAPAHAHFIWIVPERGSGQGNAKVVFSDDLEPDANVSISKIAKAELFSRSAEGKTAPLKRDEGKHCYVVTTKVPGIVGGACRYGVVQRGSGEPFLLVYHAKAIVTPPSAQELPATAYERWDALAFEVVPVGRPKVDGVRVLWQGKPLAGAEIKVIAPGSSEGVQGKTNGEGFFGGNIDAVKRPGRYAVWVRHVEAKAGAEESKKYSEVRHYATLVFDVPAVGKQRSVDAEATKLLAEARAARATWHDFPGFRADLEVNVNGKVTKTVVEVSAGGGVKLDLPDDEVKGWVRRQLGSLVSHRLPGTTERDTPCAFLDSVRDHPLGRAIGVLNDELHSSYRIRDRQILEVNRVTSDVRFTITVLENQLTPEKKYLPAAYVVNTWDNKTGALRSSSAFRDTWVRLDKFDLPRTITVITATGVAQGAPAAQAKTEGPQTLDIRTLTFSNHKLLRGSP